MNLEKQVTSLDLSKHLKELGVNQESLFYWRVNHDGFEDDKKIIFSPGVFHNNAVTLNIFYSAFTASELLEMLPMWSDLAKRDKNDYIARVFDKSYDEKSYHSFAETASDSFAKMIIHLIENKLIEV
jgi:hypothetical protein